MSTLPTHLTIGETATITVRVESSEPFAMAIALSDAYYPGRGVRFDGSAATAQATSADLDLTITGTASTADLPAVQDWPADEDWPAGVAPLAVRAGARFPGGALASASFLSGWRSPRRGERNASPPVRGTVLASWRPLYPAAGGPLPHLVGSRAAGPGRVPRAELVLGRRRPAVHEGEVDLRRL